MGGRFLELESEWGAEGGGRGVTDFYSFCT